MLQPKKSGKKPSPAKKYKQDSLAEDVFEIFDPTGISSYDDVYRSYKKNGLFSWETGLEVLGALPVIGKAGKGLKAIRTANKYIKGLNKVNKVVAKAEKVVPAVLKQGKNVGRTIQRVSRGGRANPVGVASMGVGVGAESLQKFTKVIEKGTGKVLDKVIAKAPTKQVGITTAAATLNTTNTLSDVVGAVQGQTTKKEKDSSQSKKPRIVYYNTNPKRGKVETPGDEEGVQYVPVSNSIQLEKWKAQNNVPVTSDLKTKVTREVLGTLMPDQAAQFLTAIATKDNKLGFEDLTPDIQEALIKSVKNAQKRTGKDSGGTQYIDYSPEVEQAFQGMSAGKKQMISTDPDIQAATMLGRVSYKKNALGETEIYDSYDFSKTDPKKANTLYKKIRAYAGTALPDEGKKPNLIGKIPAEEPLAFGTGAEGIGDPPTRLAFENELLSRVITERNKDKNFVKRALDPSNYPVIINEDGSETTHLMQYSTDDNGNAYVSPTVIQNELGLLSKLTPREAMKYGRKSGEEIKIPDVQLAEYYTENGLIKHGYGTNSQGIMKSKMNPRKKYANGSDAKGMNTNNYIISPAEALADYDIMMAKAENAAINNPWAPYVSAIGGAASSFLSNSAGLLTKADGAAGAIKGNAGGILKKAIAKGGNIMASNSSGVVTAMGTNNVQQDVEVEGGEMYETPQGQVGEFQGPSHAEGGIPLKVVDTPVANPNEGEVQKETKVYSDQLVLQGKTLAERKATRERQIANLEKIASQPLVDQAVKNASKRKMMAIQKEEMADLDFQEKVNNIQQMADTMVAAFGTGMAGIQDNPIGDSMRYGCGTGMKGVKKYFLGTDVNGIDPIYGNEDNRIKNLHDILKIPSTDPGYGKVIGPETKKRLLPYIKDSWVKTMEKGNPNQPAGYYSKLYDDGDKASRLYEDNTILALKGKIKEDGDVYTKNLYSSLGLTPGGRQFKEPINITPAGATELIKSKSGPELTKDLEQYVARNSVTGIETGTGTSNKKESEEPTLMGNLMRSLPGIGDALKLFGNYKGMTAGIDTATEQRASDIPFQNVFRNAGEESQRLLDNAKQGIETNKAQGIVKANTNTRTGKKAARNSARGVNQMRGMDWLYDTALNEQVADIMAKSAEQMSSIDIQKSGVAMSADQLKGQGEWQRAVADQAAKDAYYTALGQGRKDFATGMQQSGKDINDMKENDIIGNLMKNFGSYFSVDENGNLVSRATASNEKRSPKEQIVISPDGKTKFKIGKNNQLIEVTT